MNFFDVLISAPSTRKLRSFADCGDIGDYVEIEGHGRAAETYGARLPEFRNLGKGMVSGVGFLSNGRFVVESTILGLYPECAPPPDANGPIPETNTHVQALAESLTSMRVVSAGKVVDRCIVALGPWDGNYQHFLVETYPRIWFAAKNNEGNSLPVVVSDQRYTRDIIQTGLPNMNAIYLSKHELLRVERSAVYCMPFGQNMRSITEPQILALRDLRRVVMTAENGHDCQVTGSLRVFLDRLTVNSNTGARRVMANHASISDILKSRKFETIYLEERSIFEKRSILRNAKFVVSPIGANLMNLLFVEPGSRVMIIGHPHCGVFSFFADLLDKVSVGVEEIKLLTHTKITDALVPPQNAPYWVDPDEFSSLLDRMLSHDE